MAEQENGRLKAISGLIDRKLLTAILALISVGGLGGWAIGGQHETPPHAIQCMTAEQGKELTEAIKANSASTAELAKEIAELRGTINGRRGR